MRIVYFGTPDDAVAPLRAFVDAGHDVLLVVTQPDRRRGRGSSTTPSPVKAAALALGLPVRTPERARDLVDELAGFDADLAVVVAFGQLLPAAVLATARHGFVNLHFSLLPRWRGAAPVERAILAGDAETGVCVMALDEGMDTGPVYSRLVVPIGPEETAGELRARLVEVGTPLLVSTLLAITAGLEAVPQTGEATHAAKLAVEEFRLDWARPAVDLVRVVRAGNPRPGAFTECDGQRVKVLRAAVEPGEPGGVAVVGPGEPAPVGGIDQDGRVQAGVGQVRLVEVQPAGKAPMAAAAWLAGRRGLPTRFTP